MNAVLFLLKDTISVLQADIRIASTTEAMIRLFFMLKNALYQSLSSN